MLDDQETEENAVDVEEVCHRRRWKRELGVDEVEVLATVEKDGGSVKRLVQCGSSKVVKVSHMSVACCKRW